MHESRLPHIVCCMLYGWNERRTLAMLGLACLLLCLLVAAVRGCRLAGRETETEADLTLLVYLHGEDRTVEMDLDDYLYGVVGGEMPASFPLEALKAQAVAARTYTVRRMASQGGDPCGRQGADVCTDSTCCQSYRSPEALEAQWGDAAQRNGDKLREAVAGTHGIIAVYEGAPIEALYHSTAGGRTEDAQNVFSNALPYLVGVDSPGEQDAAHYEDTETFSRKTFASTINKGCSGAKLKADQLETQVEILSRFDSGQVEAVRLGKAEISGKEMRKLLGLRSANFQIAFTQDEVRVTTRGYGHGVGLSQYGARAMALEGADYTEILKHYYTGIDLESIQ